MAGMEAARLAYGIPRGSRRGEPVKRSRMPFTKRKTGESKCMGEEDKEESQGPHNVSGNYFEKKGCEPNERTGAVPLRSWMSVNLKSSTARAAYETCLQVEKTLAAKESEQRSALERATRDANSVREIILAQHHEREQRVSRHLVLHEGNRLDQIESAMAQRLSVAGAASASLRRTAAYCELEKRGAVPLMPINRPNVTNIMLWHTKYEFRTTPQPIDNGSASGKFGASIAERAATSMSVDQLLKILRENANHVLVNLELGIRYYGMQRETAALRYLERAVKKSAPKERRVVGGESHYKHSSSSEPVSRSKKESNARRSSQVTNAVKQKETLPISSSDRQRFLARARHFLFEIYVSQGLSKRQDATGENFQRAATHLREWIILQNWAPKALLEAHESLALLHEILGPLDIERDSCVLTTGSHGETAVLHIDVLKRLVEVEPLEQSHAVALGRLYTRCFRFEDAKEAFNRMHNTAVRTPASVRSNSLSERIDYSFDEYDNISAHVERKLSQRKLNHKLSLCAEGSAHIIARLSAKNESRNLLATRKAQVSATLPGRADPSNERIFDILPAGTDRQVAEIEEQKLRVEHQRMMEEEVLSRIANDVHACRDEDEARKTFPVTQIRTNFPPLGLVDRDRHFNQVVQ